MPIKPKRPAHPSPVRIHADTRTRLDKLVARISALGWRAVGSSRDAVPGIASVIDEGLLLLEAKLPKGK